jgi:arylsulfatase
VYDFKYDGLGAATLAFNNVSGVGRSGTETLKVDGKAVSTKRMERSIPLGLPLDQTFNIGTSAATPIDDRDYKVPFPFTSKISKVTLAVGRPKLTPVDERKFMEANRAAQDAK